VKHFHVYDTCGEVMCVDADNWQLVPERGVVLLYNGPERPSPATQIVATFNWSNVVCVREEEDDDEGETVDIPPVFSGALN
jgi:hypothetical protein